ncbi:unnamed protein product [Acanthoscelides obtectus]|uniref:Uncharacterized protein n=1 Tax=Acanthoscelides obtectus TaxID=200917 RepID=A0A9P0L6I4_ACAOB|nr:unnamed protein product [Acanthoscelides obtectus]CAK1666278.1 hypothetical protein AOBTE_LOCUS25237 [Acanthoscelides obtectus]
MNSVQKYVPISLGIVETMSYSDKVANFLEAPTDELETISMDDLELVAGDVLEKVRSLPNSPLASRENSPLRIGTRTSSPSSSSPSPTNVADDSEHSDEEYTDTIENPEPRKMLQSCESIPNGYIPSTTPSQHISRSRTKFQNVNVDISHEISQAVSTLKIDIEKLNKRLDTIECSSKSALQSRRLFFGGLPTRAIVFILMWPFVVNFIMNRVIVRRK